MKILFFTNEYSHPKLPPSGGVGSFLKIMSEALSKQGHEIHVHGFSKRAIRFEENGIKFSFFKKYAKIFPLKDLVRSLSTKLNIKNAEENYLIAERKFLAKKIKTYCQEHHIDIIESFVFDGYTTLFDNSTPLILRFHGSRGFWHKYLGAKEDRIKTAMEKSALGNCSNLVAVSKFSANSIKSIYGVDAHKIIYNGIDTAFFSPSRTNETINQSIFYFGTMSKAKGVDILCQAFNQIVESHPFSTLHLIGRGEGFWSHLRKNILSQKAVKSTTYYGPKNKEDLKKLLQKASICVFPSLNETFGLVVAEAMALEKPVVCSDIPAFKEIIDHNTDGLIVKSQADYVTFIRDLLDNPQKSKELAETARIKVQSKFSIERMINESLIYYQEILEKK